MTTAQEINAAIDTLPSAERAKLESLLRETGVPESPRLVQLPDQAARRGRILGDKVLPNLVLQERGVVSPRCCDCQRSAFLWLFQQD
ncbi:MAG: hypothetical protein ABSG04_12465 [Verrucomicrobiota bacterium]